MRVAWSRSPGRLAASCGLDVCCSGSPAARTLHGVVSETSRDGLPDDLDHGIFYSLLGIQVFLRFGIAVGIFSSWTFQSGLELASRSRKFGALGRSITRLYKCAYPYVRLANKLLYYYYYYYYYRGPEG